MLAQHDPRVGTSTDLVQLRNRSQCYGRFSRDSFLSLAPGQSDFLSSILVIFHKCSWTTLHYLPCTNKSLSASFLSFSPPSSVPSLILQQCLPFRLTHYFFLVTKSFLGCYGESFSEPTIWIVVLYSLLLSHCFSSMLKFVPVLSSLLNAFWN